MTDADRTGLFLCSDEPCGCRACSGRHRARISPCGLFTLNADNKARSGLLYGDRIQSRIASLSNPMICL